MADVRLTATNPEDSSVVPVACDASGRLLLEEPGQGPPGPEGPPGPKGDDGDPFSGNFADDVTFGGSATFAGDVTVNANIVSTGSISCDQTIYTKKWLQVDRTGPRETIFYGRLNSTPTVTITADGSAEFAGGIVNIESDGRIITEGDNAYVHVGLSKDANKIPFNIYNTAYGNESLARIAGDGSANFAGRVTIANKAGFTEEGYLWCTTRRGDTVILDSTSNGLGQWVEYEPPSRKQQIKDKLDSLREETGEMPTDTP